MGHLLVLILGDSDQLASILNAWREAGVSGMTILEGVGARQLEEHALRDDTPLLPSFRSLLLDERKGNQIILSVITDETVLERAIQATKQVIGDFAAPQAGILFVVPVTRVWGIRG